MTAMRILKLDSEQVFQNSGLDMAPKNLDSFITTIDEYEFHTTDLSQYNVVVVTDFIDQEYLYEHRQLIEDFLAAGKIVIACTHIFRHWLPGTNFFMPKAIRKHSDYEVMVTKEDSFYAGVDMMELTYRKGVGGFFARGYHPVTNHHAEVILTFTDGSPVTVIDRTSTNGTILAHAGRDLLSYSSGNNTTKLIKPQLFAWIEQELTRLKENA